MMRIRHHLTIAACIGLAACQPAAKPAETPAATGGEAAATFGAGQIAPRVVDSQAVQILRRSMDYLNSLQRFSVKTEIVTEDLLDTGNRVDYVAWGSVTVERPNKLRGERHGVGFRQTLYFDGSTMTLADSARNVYATKAAPGGIPNMFEMAYDSLGLSVPISDLVWPDVFPLLMKDVNLARVVGKEIIDGVICDHLVFSRPQVEFQIWIPDAGTPLPRKYMVSDPATPALLSMGTILSEWKVNPPVSADLFAFTPPKGAQEVPFLNPETNQ